MNKVEFRKLFDKIYSKLPAAYHEGVLKTYAKNRELALKSGFQVFPQMFYSPLIDPGEIDHSLLDQKRDLPGIEINLDAALELVQELGSYADEFDRWAPRDGSGRIEWSETFTTMDSAFLYTLIRHLKPKRYIEVGCGHSSRVSSAALRANAEEGHEVDSSYIEPYPGPILDGFDLHGELVVKRIEEMPIEYFKSLGAGDILFIDTSHVIKAQNDVEWELLHIFPSLASGVSVHIHDIYTPYEQPQWWLLDLYLPRYSNEQYALECLLSGGGSFETLLPIHLLGREHPEELSQLITKGLDHGQSYWIRKC
ncbi:class I SAM-dependent methyltransferase [Haloferula sp. A504]|uniref:class I SAM-dependent methyltransferase n=1 Tax=Haloferula sp. A504 TaxID=3373601 RepID=UPI0031C61A92|nr:class I SAM-dependent methyltransferase [Verrucomicrobiaceae bacterium E54]